MPAPPPTTNAPDDMLDEAVVAERVTTPPEDIATASLSEDEPIYFPLPITMSSEKLASWEKVVLPSEAIAMASLS